MFIHVSPDLCGVLQSVQFQGEGVHRWWAGVNGAGTPGATSQLPNSNSGPELEDSSGAICSHSGSSRVPRLPWEYCHLTCTSSCWGGAVCRLLKRLCSPDCWVKWPAYCPGSGRVTSVTRALRSSFHLFHIVLPQNGLKSMVCHDDHFPLKSYLYKMHMTVCEKYRQHRKLERKIFVHNPISPNIHCQYFNVFPSSLFSYAFKKITIIFGAEDVSDVTFYLMHPFFAFHHCFMLFVIACHIEYVGTILANESRIKWETFIYSWRV